MTSHDLYAVALRRCNFIPVSSKRHFGKECEMFVRRDGWRNIVWAYCDYGFLWRCLSECSFDQEVGLLSNLFTIHAGRS